MYRYNVVQSDMEQSELRTQNSECLFRYKCKAIIIFVTNK